MGETVLTRRLFGRLSYACCAFLILFVGLVPFSFIPKNLPGPDLLLCLTFAFVLRRPDYIPVWLLAGAIFLSDVLLLRPPGLWTAIMIFAVEFTRLQEYRFRDLIFPFEWAFVGAIMFLCLISYHLVLSIMIIPQVGFSTTMLHFLTTLVAYPLVVGFCALLLRLRKVTPHEAIRYGHRL
ncbi:MAG: rod shape-determining protein MreD [Paracoccaceae bacterium]|jgi:rod shape-determining protein MreD